MLQGLLTPLLLAAWVAVVAALPLPEQCTSEMNKIEDLLEVSCVEKGLTSIPGGLPEDTGILLLASNQLAKVALASFQHLPLLWKLDLSNNSLKVLETGATLPKLKKLLLSHNGLESLPSFLGLPSLTCLALGHNRLSQLPERGFHGLGQLQDLELQGNQLQSLPGGAFQGLLALEDLDLSDNRLEALPPELLDKLDNLKILRLERNRLERVPRDFFLGITYGYIYLVENPWLCDCRLDYLREWIKENDAIVYTRMTVQEDGLDKEVTENEPQKVLCHAPPQVKGQAVMNFTTICRKLGDEVQEVEAEGGPAEDSWTPSLTPPPSTAAAPWTPPFLAASRRSSPSPSTAVSPTGAALTTTSSTSALSSTTTHCPTTSSPGPTTALHPLTTTAAFAAFGLSTSGATAGKSTATSNGPMTTPGPSTAHAPTTGVPTTMATSRNPPALSPTASMLTTPLPPSAPPPTTTAAGHPPSTAALVPSTSTHVKSSPRISAPLSSREFSAPPAPKPSAHCLCPALPVRVLGVAARQGSKAEWLAGSCCLLRLVLYLTCLALVALPTLALLCWLGWLSLDWDRPAVRGAPGSRLAQPQQWQEASPKGWQLKFAETPPRPTSGPRIYRVCKKFQVAPARHITWLLVSLPGSGRKWAQMQARLSSYSLDRGKDTLGAVRVKYAAASL